MPVVHRTHVRISRIRPPLPRRVRHHHLRLLPYLLIRLAQRNRIPITLRHLSPIQPRYPRRLGQHHIRLGQNMSELKQVRVFAESLQEILNTLRLGDGPEIPVVGVPIRQTYLEILNVVSTESPSLKELLVSEFKCVLAEREPIEEIEPTHNLARNLHMGYLIFPHRNK